MRVRRVDQNAAAPVDTFQRFRHLYPMCSKNNDVTFGRLLFCAGDGAWTKAGDKISQCLRTSGIGYDDGVTSVDQVTTECACHVPGSNKSYFHDQSPISVRLARMHALSS